MPAESWSWREVPVLEAVLRLYRRGEDATPEVLAAEAILHLDDVRAGLARLVDDGYLDSVAVITDTGVATTIVSPSPGLRRLLRTTATEAGAPERDQVAAQTLREDPRHGSE